MNLRIHVRGPSGPGIWFFSLDAAAATAVLGARLTYGLPYYLTYGLPYHWSRMTVRATGRRRIHHTSARTGAAANITVERGEALAEPDDLTVFLTERYRLYTSFRGRLATAQSNMSRGPCIVPPSSASRRRYARRRTSRTAPRPRSFTIPQAFTCALVRCVS